MKPAELKIKRINKTRINAYIISTLEIDLKHINYGLTRNKGYGKKKRSNFSVDEVAIFLNHWI